MKKLNNYINEAWSGVKKQSNNANIEDWCEEMGIKNYTINSQGEIDVNRDVELNYKDFKELPYKFGRVKGYFNLGNCKNLTSLKNCPNEINGGFSCRYCEKLISLEGCPKKIEGSFFCNRCKSLNSLEGCPKEVKGGFWCGDCKRKFTIEEVMSLCKVKKEDIHIND